MLLKDEGESVTVEQISKNNSDYSDYISSFDFGYMALGRVGFRAFPVEFDTTTGVQGLYSWRVGVFQPDPNIIINRTGDELDLGHARWRKDELTLHPGAHGESAALSVSVKRPGYLLAVALSEHKSTEFPPAEVNLIVNDEVVATLEVGKPLSLKGFFAPDDRLQIGVATPEGLIYYGKSTAVRAAFFALRDGCNPETTQAEDFVRLDTDGSALTLDEIETAVADALTYVAPPATRYSPRPLKDWKQALLSYLDPALTQHLEACFGENINAFIERCLERDLLPPRKRAVTYFTPRSGSTAFAELQSRAGGQGRPVEYCVEPIFSFFSAILRLRGEDLDVFSFIERVTADAAGVFAIQIDIDRLSANPVLANRLLHYDAHLYHTRKDLIKQGISHYKAVFGGAWSSVDAGQDTLEFSRQDIVASIRGISEQLIAWEDYFSANTLAPQRVYYEDMIADPNAELRRVAELLGTSMQVGPAPRLCDLVWQPLNNRSSLDFRKQLLGSGGEFRGFDLHPTHGAYEAVLAGLQPADLPPAVYCDGLRFHATDLQAIRAVIDAYIHG